MRFFSKDRHFNIFLSVVQKSLLQSSEIRKDERGLFMNELHIFLNIDVIYS